jgi:hypothetical protein
LVKGIEGPDKGPPFDLLLAIVETERCDTLADIGVASW